MVQLQLMEITVVFLDCIKIWLHYTNAIQDRGIASSFAITGGRTLDYSLAPGLSLGAS